MNHWDEKFDSDNYIYGEEANEFVKNIFQTNTTNNENIVLFAEGEGRNAIYLAQLGYDVTTYDMSKVGIDKQYKLAQETGVNIKANYGDITQPDLTTQSTFDYSINIFGHVPAEGKQAMFNNLIQSLVKNGHSYFEFYSIEQLEYRTGGPKDKSMLYEIDEIKHYLSQHTIKIHMLKKRETYRYEGTKHTGLASVIQGHIEKL
ncbi:MAG: methyltransferase domain-containing protein [Staphylococcus equorum]|uniref:class I SAM-dependent methyltransferase n=1 Tax=Staphylococcus TaxID=1279 RepID=UPI0008535141|nr:methyltransferase domain-containing protein [Staphylococcus equorum]MDG0823259.1 methyltransferase domain-containing protein [Staphylococcus equorum]MDK9871510.1 methyltransferase domain-containing protein [Staphylococcus equorum]MDK9877921.1 methyltransferase domain-containing protein [Staphylococcus equorum]MDN5809607.1 methyltransferase domain-containing protein [Staphylococcus equorum]MDN5828813.1 methyltransferase domain-containing protein [Staphylococcus equorum]